MAARLNPQVQTDEEGVGGNGTADPAALTGGDEDTRCRHAKAKGVVIHRGDPEVEIGGQWVSSSALRVRRGYLPSSASGWLAIMGFAHSSSANHSPYGAPMSDQCRSSIPQCVM